MGCHFGLSFSVLLVSWILQCLLILLSVAFFTLFERNVIGLFHSRLGPNKVSFFGVVQPLLDAFNLLTKQSFSPLHSNNLVYNLSPHLALFLALFTWLVIPLSYNLFSLSYSLLMFFCVSSVMVFSVLLSGWSSNSKYSLIGSLRSIAQSISYEVVLSTNLILVSFVLVSFSILSFISMSSFFLLIIFPIWFICILAETHRAPFDFSESESELVSGFNTEYSGAYFAFLFLSEYAMLLFSCFLIVYIFIIPFLWILSWNLHSFMLVVSSLLFSFLFIWVRITYCRFRYDLLIMFAWKSLLPLSLTILVVSFFVLFF